MPTGCCSDERAREATGHVGSPAEPRRLQVAYAECVDADLGTLEQGDGGASLLIDTDSEYGSFEELACVLDALGTSEATVAALDHTTAMMGVQTAEEDGLGYRWSYHPDNGVNMIITEGSG